MSWKAFFFPIYTQHQWKLPLLKFRYFENYKRHLDSYFTFYVFDQLQIRPTTREQLLHMHFVLFAVSQIVKTLFSKTNMPVYAWKIFLENAIEIISIIPSNRASEAHTFRNHHHHLASSHKTQWKHLVFSSERVSCIHVWRTPFSVVPIHGTVHHKNESWTEGNSLSRKIQMCSCVKCTQVSGNFSLMPSIFKILIIRKLTHYCFVQGLFVVYKKNANVVRVTLSRRSLWFQELV